MWRWGGGWGGIFLPTQDVSFLVERAPPVYHHLCLHLVVSIHPRIPGVCKEDLDIGSLALPLPTQSRHCPLLAALWRKGAGPGRGCRFPARPVTQGRSAGLTAHFSLEDCDAYVPTGSITFYYVYFSREHTLHFHLHPSFSSPLSL